MTYEEFIEEWNGCEDCIVCHTSGSTGKPKEIRLPKAEVAKSARRTLDFFGIDGPESCFYSCISPDFIGGKMQAVRAVVSGGRFLYETPSNRPQFNATGTRKIDLLSVVPSQMISMLERIGELPEIGNILVGGAPIPDALRERIAMSGLNAWETYGMTETASHVALRKISHPQKGFVPLLGIRLSLAADGALVIDLEGWKRIRVNDSVRILKGTPQSITEFEIVGRLDNVIITGGKKVQPEEVEKTLESLLGCEVMVSWEEDLKWGQKIVLIVPGNNLDSSEIMRICRENLESHCVPKLIERGEIPRTGNGKKRRKQAI